MKIPMEVLLERLAYLNPEVALSDRDVEVRGVRLLPVHVNQISKEYVYFCHYSDFDQVEQDLILIAILPPGAQLPARKNYILLRTDMPIQNIMNDLLGLETLLQNWERDMIQAMGSGPSLQRLLELSEPVLGNPVVVLDPALRTLGCIRGYEIDDVVFKELTELGYLTQESFNRLKTHNYFTEDHYTGQTLILPPSEIKAYTSTLTAILDGTNVRYLVLMLCSNVECTPGLMALFQVLLERIRICLSSLDDVMGEQREQYEYFILDLLEKRNMSSEEIEERSRCFLNIRKQTYHCIVIQLNRSTDMYRKHAQMTLSNCCADWEPIIYKGKILILATLDDSGLLKQFDAQSQLERLTDFLRHADAKAGISNEFTSYAGLRNAYEQGTAALELGRVLEKGRLDLYWYADYATYQWLSAAGEKLGLQQMLHPVVPSILDYDRTHRTEYLLILESFLKHERNYTNTPQEHNNHPNNLIYHKKRIIEQF